VVRTRRLAAALLVALALVGVAATRQWQAPSPQAAPHRRLSASVPAPNGVDFLYASMMVVHHAQAVSMSRTLLVKSGVPERVRNIADYIVHDQQREIDQMNAWLEAWNQPAVDPADPALKRLHGDGPGHGMLSDAQLAQAARAPAAQATPLYLRQMIEHHKGAITMSRSVLQGGSNVFIRGLNNRRP
jgi:uncharacterized protein (DUF305 family)